jgi:hypothetical protein
MRGQQSLDFDRVTFDSEEGEKRKEEGLAQAQLSLPRKQLLEMARLYAISIAVQRGFVTYDDVFIQMFRDGLNPADLGSAAGSVFRGDFIFTGQWQKSARVSNHARVNRVWKLKDVAATKKPVARVEEFVQQGQR